MYHFFLFSLAVSNVSVYYTKGIYSCVNKPFIIKEHKMAVRKLSKEYDIIKYCCETILMVNDIRIPQTYYEFGVFTLFRE